MMNGIIDNVKTKLREMELAVAEFNKELGKDTNGGLQVISTDHNRVQLWCDKDLFSDEEAIVFIQGIADEIYYPTLDIDDDYVHVHFMVNNVKLVILLRYSLLSEGIQQTILESMQSKGVA